MKIKHLLLIVGIFISGFSYGQDLEGYTSYAQIANKAHEAKDYSKSLENYEKAFDLRSGNAAPEDRYNAACSNAMLGNIDQSFYHLMRLAKTNSVSKTYDQVIGDAELTKLHDDNRWNLFIGIVKKNSEMK